MSIQDFLQDLGFEVTHAGSQLRVDCPACDDEKGHLYLAPGNGVGFCHKCSWSPNPYKLVEKVTTKTPAEIMALLDKFGLNDSDKGSGEKPEPPKRKPLALSKDNIRSLTDDEKRAFCKLKGLDVKAFERFRPYAHKTEPWVLLPAFSPNDLDKACGWLRCGIDGQEIRLADGRMEKYPAIAGSRHGLFGLPWLMKENPDTIIFTEAWRDALAAISIGLNATASSGGASKWDDDWLALFTGKKVYLCFDCDEAGQRAMARAARAIATVAAEVFIVKLPYEFTKDHGKDVHDYIVADGYGKDFLLLLSRAEKYRSNRDEQTKIVLANGYPMTIAERFYKELTNQRQIWRHYNHMQAWCIYNGRVYEIAEPADTRAMVWRFTSKCMSTNKKGDPIALNCTENTIKNTLSAMASFEGVEIKSYITAPAWLLPKEGIPAEYVIAVSNGLLDVSADNVKLIDHTPDFLNFNILGYDYAPDAKCPEWIKFLGEVFEMKDDDQAEGVPDEDKIMSLQEWFGLLLTSETKYHKMLGIIGPKRSGKSTIARILTAMIGAENVATPTFASMTDTFGLQGFLNAKVAVFGDASMDKDPVVVGRAVEKLKTISGEDGIDVNRKYERVMTGVRLKVRFVMISNNLQRLTDPTGTVSDRFIFLRTTQSFYGNEDMGLEKRLMGELPGIVNWAIEGLKRLRGRGNILEPAESIEMRTQSKEIGSNVIAFVNNACNIGDGLHTEPDNMYDAFKKWCEEDGSKPMKKRSFRAELNEAFGEHACSKHRVPGHDNPIWVYWNIEPHLAYTY